MEKISRGKKIALMAMETSVLEGGINSSNPNDLLITDTIPIVSDEWLMEQVDASLNQLHNAANNYTTLEISINNEDTPILENRNTIDNARDSPPNKNGDDGTLDADWDLEQAISQESPDSEDEVPVNAEDAEALTDHQPVENLEELRIRKRSRNAKNSQSWEQKQAKNNREQGHLYKGKKKVAEGNWNYQVNRPGRFLSAPCNCLLARKKSQLKCYSIDEKSRRAIFDKFWTKMSWDEKKMYVTCLVKTEDVKRRRGVSEETRRNFSMKYYLKKGNDTVRVCKKMFVGTLGLKERNVLNWIKDNLKVDGEEEAVNRKSLVRKEKCNKKMSALKEFFEGLPKMESHYCRSSSKKLYLEPIWRSKSHLYAFYKNDFCNEKKVQCVSDATFYSTFEELNLSLFRPKKDECDICVARRTSNINEDEYQQHQLRKEEARQEKEKDKFSEDVVVFTVDLQSVLLSPKTNVSAMYYKTKLIVHNFTIYNLQTKEAYCFIWNEAEGSLTANEFASILVHFIETKVLPKEKETGKKIIFYSDGCTGQNRNSTLANALLHLSYVHNVTICQKYLEKGHTQMEVDSMHSAIERVVKRTKINLPADYIEVCISARKNPFPYEVKYLTHDFFKNFESLQYFNSIRPGRSTGDPTVTNIKALKYENGTIQYKLKHSEENWSDLPRRSKKTMLSTRFADLPCLYNSRRKIKKEKYEHLKALLQGINQEYHEFYLNLPHE